MPGDPARHEGQHRSPRQPHRSHQQHQQSQGEGGIPDGLLVGVLAFLLGLSLLVWTATGLAGLFARGAWPDGVTFTNTPLAMRSLVSQPHDIPAAWPGTPPNQLSGYGLFWGLLIGQLMVLVVLTVFTLGTVARWRAVRASRRAQAQSAGTRPGMGRASATPAAPAAPDARSDAGAASAGGATAVEACGTEASGTGGEGTALTAQAAHSTAGTSWPPPPGPSRDGHRTPPHGARPAVSSPSAPAHPTPSTAEGTPNAGGQSVMTDRSVIGDSSAAPGPKLATGPAAAGLGQEIAPAAHTVQAPRGPRVLCGDRAARRTATIGAISDAAGPAVVVTSDPAVWAETKDGRAKLGPVLVYDPGHLCDTPARLHWSPTTGCADPETAAARAAALLAPVRPHSRLDEAVADTAETLLRCWLHAAAVDGRPFKQIHRWAQGNGAREPVRILRTHPKAVSGMAGLLESALTAHTERREIAQELTVRTLTCLSSIHIREACNPNRADSLILESFTDEGGTLYVVGESIEDPRTRPGAMPLLTALTSSVVEHGRRMAARSSAGRLDPPLTLVLDDIAAVAPIPLLPELLKTGQERGLPTVALLRSQEQGRARWPGTSLMD